MTSTKNVGKKRKTQKNREAYGKCGNKRGLDQLTDRSNNRSREKDSKYIHELTQKYARKARESKRAQLHGKFGPLTLHTIGKGYHKRS